MANPHDASDEEKQNGGESFTIIPRNRSFPSTQALTIILLIVQSLFTIRLWSMNKSCFTSTPRNGDLIRKIWHRNTSYMSLDHAYDSLWNETGQSALVYDDEKNVVQITMQVRSCFYTGSTSLHNDKQANCFQGSTSFTA
jgi:hypothetical protein